MTFGLAASAAAQAALGSCFELDVTEPFWRASDSVASAPAPAPSKSSVVGEGPTRFRLDSDGLTRVVGNADLHDLDTGALHSYSGWEFRGDTLEVRWGEHWYDVALGEFGVREDGSWFGSIRRVTDVVVIPDPGEWRYAATLTEIACEPPDAGFSTWQQIGAWSQERADAEAVFTRSSTGDSIVYVLGSDGTRGEWVRQREN